jgi:hypothetical protein
MDLPDSLAAANVYIFAAMTSSVLIAARVSPQTKARLAALANTQQLTESAFLERLVESAFQVISPLSSEAALRACEGLRDAFRKLIIANVKNWESGHQESQK